MIKWIWTKQVVEQVLYVHTGIYQAAARWWFSLGARSLKFSARSCPIFTCGVNKVLAYQQGLECEVYSVVGRFPGLGLEFGMKSINF